jgi:hypothetical protein
MALTDAPLPAIGTRTVYLQAVGANLEVAPDAGEITQIERTSLELRDLPATLADEVVVMVLCQLVTRTATQIQPPHQPQPRKKIQRPVNRHHPNPGTTGPYVLETLVLLGRNSLQYRQPLRRGLVPTAAYLPHGRLDAHNLPL